MSQERQMSFGEIKRSHRRKRKPEQLTQIDEQMDCSRFEPLLAQIY
ncbi:hypothetical protein [Magnetococcus sp. PR-3]